MKYLSFNKDVIETEVTYTVVTMNGTMMGRVKYSPHWGTFIFQPTKLSGGSLMFDSHYLQEITKFLDKMNHERKEEKKK